MVYVFVHLWECAKVLVCLPIIINGDICGCVCHGVPLGAYWQDAVFGFGAGLRNRSSWNVSIIKACAECCAGCACAAVFGGVVAENALTASPVIIGQGTRSQHGADL